MKDGCGTSLIYSTEQIRILQSGRGREGPLLVLLPQPEGGPVPVRPCVRPPLFQKMDDFSVWCLFLIAGQQKIKDYLFFCSLRCDEANVCKEMYFL